MDGGDMAVKSEGVGGHVASIDAIDANSVRTADFTEERTVGGTKVFLTEEGAKYFDAQRDNETTFVAETDRKAGFFERLFSMNVDGRAGQKFGPKPEDK